MSGKQTSPAPPLRAGNPVAGMRRPGRVWQRPTLVQLPAALAVATLLAGLVTVKLHHFRAGCYLVALAMLGAAGLRLALPARRAGLLVVRSRPLDVVVLGSFGLAVLLLAKVVRAQ